MTVMSYLCLSLGKAQVMALITFAGLGRTLNFFKEGAGCADGLFEVSHETFLLRGAVSRNVLPVWASHLQGLAALLIQLDLEVGQM